ncbi:hypothetical protein, partial [Actinotignum timonense]|uniref:hypothetical protein n=1 Tax=Actinotignum timonense TaxID=1870995 RepID=UPI002A822BBB
SHYAFGQLPLGKETIKVYEQTKLDETRARIAFEAAQSGDVSVSKLESKMLESEGGCGLFIGHYRLKPLDDAPQSLNHRT